ncbi:DUF4912 domain-containing protein [Geitlerinema sp. PCC 7407]|uniref:DUF4912 domain-containing protein n=1 Tax=Geitlerinema sp. PCC 7407 TaxID=1173025 RepID=UPI00029FF9B9|nr:DUF4912 domain-containing protein [Geitlerinema sp. PCC 7407]AFY66940.1 Rho termination factor domain protein [Geitlerinema sp. PCC 7407]
MAKERPPLEEMTLRQLRRVASEYGISRYSRMRKSQLLASIQEVQRTKFSLSPSRTLEAQEEVEAAKFELGQEDRTGGELSSVDEGLADLPSGYGESRIVLLPRDPQWAYAYWDVPNEHKEDARRQGGLQLALRLYDVTDINLEHQSPHSLQEYPCDELAREWYLPVPVSDRDYAIDIGYRCADGRWLVLARSLPVHIPPVYPSDWIEDNFITINWDEELRGKKFFELVPPSKKPAPVAGDSPLYEKIFGMAQGAEAQRVAGSLFGSMQHVAGSVVSSYVFPSGVGMWALPTESGMGLTMSGAGMSGVGFSASMPPIRPRKFWLVADAELIVYGATEPDATVTIGGQPIKLNPDGTFRFQMSFQDGLIDYPIMAVAADGEQTRSIHMKFNRETPSRNTNTKAEAVEEWLV